MKHMQQMGDAIHPITEDTFSAYTWNEFLFDISSQVTNVPWKAAMIMLEVCICEGTEEKFPMVLIEWIDKKIERAENYDEVDKDFVDG